MKRFIISILSVAVFFVGIGTLVEKAGARFKSDQKSLDLVAKARQAIGGDSALAAVQSMRIVGQTTQTTKVEGVDRVRQGETEIALQLPDKFMKITKIGKDDAAGEGKAKIDRQVNVVMVSKDKDGRQITIDGEPGLPGEAVRKIVIKKPDGTTEEITGAEADKFVVKKMDGDKAIWTSENGGTMDVDGKQVFVRSMGGQGHARHNEMLRFTLSLLLTAPQGMDVSYTFGGESVIDGTACNIVVAEFAGSAFKIYLGASSNLPVMLSYTGHKMPRMVAFTKTAPADGAAETMTFQRAENHTAETAEFNVRFADYRSVGGVQLPHTWTQTVGGVADETFDVTSYEINPVNIAEKFQNHKVMVRTPKPEMQ